MKNTSSSLKPTQSKAGFTRADLLAVLGGLLLLAIAQWPLLGKSREGGHEAVCMNNLRQLGLAMLMYASENQDAVPEEGNSSLSIADSQNVDAWYNLAVQPKYPKLVNLYLSGNPPLPQNGSVYSCPACPPPSLANGYPILPTMAKAFFMYAENMRICINKSTRNGGPNTKFSQIPKPGDTILLAEQDPTTATDPSESVTSGYYAVARHQGFGIFAMSDGHVRAARTNEFLRTSAESNSAATEWAKPRTNVLVSNPNHAELNRIDMEGTTRLTASAGFLFALLISLTCAPAQTLIGPTRPVTAPGIASLPADGGSFAPAFGGDGRYLVFVSQANNLVTNDDTGSSLDVFVRDLVAGTTQLVSVNSSGQGGGNGNSGYPVISSNGQFVAFLSTATNLVSADTNALPDLYVRDTVAGTTMLQSVTPSGTVGGGGCCLGLDMTPDGHLIVFSSTQTNLVSNTVSACTNLFLRDRQAGTTTLLTTQAANPSVGAHGNSDFPAISADGQKIVFYSEALDLVSWGGSPPAAGQVYLRDRQAGTTVCIGTNAQPFITGSMCSSNMALSSDGSAAAFIAASTTSSQCALVYYNLSSGQTSLITNNVDPTSWPEISASGQRVAYASKTNVFVWDAQSAASTLVNVGTDGSVNGTSRSPVIAADGSRVAFVSNATNLTANATNGAYQLFVRDLASGVTRLVSQNLSGGPSSDQGLCTPAISVDGRRVAFASPDASLVAGDYNNASDVFVWSWAASQVEMVSQKEPLRPSSTDRAVPLFGSQAVSSDGRFVAFATLDGNLVSGDTNGLADVFLRDMLTGSTTLVSGDANGLPTSDGPASSPALSSDGRYVAFLRSSPLGTNSQMGDVYLRDLNTGTITLVSATATGVGKGTASPPTLSPDGHYVAFSTPSALADIDTNQHTDVYLYDIQHGTNGLVSVAPNGSLTAYDSSNAVFSPDSQWVVFQSKSPSLVTPPLGTSTLQLYARNLVSGITHHVSYAPGGVPFAGDNSDATFSADSQHVAFKSTTGFPTVGFICVHNLATGVNQLVCYDCYTPSLSGDGSKVAYRKTSTTRQVYVTDFQAGQTNLISVATDGTSLGNGASWGPVVSPDGRFVIFTSRASNLVLNDTNSCADLYARDLVLGSTIAISASRVGPTTGNGSSVNGVLAADGRTVVFESSASDLAANDLNANPHLFLARLGIGDSDGDGMDDDWEMTYFGNLSHDGSADTDHDGFTDLQEFQAGTNPTNNTSVLRCLTVTAATNGATVYWSAVPGRSYRIEYKNSLSDADWKVLVGAVPANSAMGSVLDEGASLASQRYYRVVALP